MGVVAWFVLLMWSGLLGCATSRGTAPPPDGWANYAPTRVDQVVERDGAQLIAVSQGEVTTWVAVPDVGAEPGEYLLLGQGTLRKDVTIPELGVRVPEVVDIAHARVVDLETAERAIRFPTPKGAVAIGVIYAELEQRADQEVVVVGTVVKAPNAIGWNWVHLQDGSGDREADTHDITVKTQHRVLVGQRVAFRGVLRQDVDLGFGYHYTALVEGGDLVR